MGQDAEQEPCIFPDTLNTKVLQILRGDDDRRVLFTHTLGKVADIFHGGEVCKEQIELSMLVPVIPQPCTKVNHFTSSRHTSWRFFLYTESLKPRRRRDMIAPSVIKFNTDICCEAHRNRETFNHSAVYVELSIPSCFDEDDIYDRLY